MTVFGNPTAQFSSVSMVTATPGVNDPEVGTVRREGDEEYIFVYNNGGSTIAVGNFAVVSAVTGYSVTVSSTSMIDVPVGVCKHAAIAASSYGWLLRKGFGPALAGTVIIPAGALLSPGGDGVWTARLASTAYSQSIAGAVYGKQMTSAACAATGDAYFNIA